MFQLKRAYDPPDVHDGTRVLVDRLQPRGLSKARAHIDLWMKDIAPSTELRDLARQETVTLIVAARDREHGEGAVLRDLLQAT